MSRYPDDNPKTAVGATKPTVGAVPPVAEIYLGMAMADGERKYGIFNWRESPVSSSTYYNAMRRHLAAWWDGEDSARDSGIHHLAHVMACCAILLDAKESGALNDNRGPAGAVADLIDRLVRERVAATEDPIAVQTFGPLEQYELAEPPAE